MAGSEVPALVGNYIHKSIPARILARAMNNNNNKPKMVAEIYGRLNLSLVRSVARAIMGRELAHE